MPNTLIATDAELCNNFSSCLKNVENATELYKFLLRKHCVDYLTQQFLYDNYTDNLRERVTRDLDVLTRHTPYLASADLNNLHLTGELVIILHDRNI